MSSPAPSASTRATPGVAERALRAFHTYASWLVSISWKRFLLLSLLLLIIMSILESLPPFTWRVTEVIETPKVPKPPRRPAIKVEKPKPGASAPDSGIDITIDERGVRITPRAKADAASAPASAASGVSLSLPEVLVKLPPGADSEAVREAVQEAKEAVREAIDEARDAAREAAHEATAAADSTPRVRTRKVTVGDFLVDLAFLWIFSSAIIKFTYKGQLQAEVKAAQATETAEAEQLKRQVIEARMAAMQAQVEPHFLFNTLASIDHLIETDPARASTMQKNLIALLRASMPTMREANAQGVRDLGRELGVIRPYLEILKVRMEERLQTEIDVPEGLHSAEFPPMMIQGLVENAVKHGLEPKPDGGKLTVRAQIVHGKLAVTVADTGLGFGRAATAGTGVGLANVRERLHLLYGNKAALTVAENQPSGTVVTITVPYRARTEGEGGNA
jgi:signal transduction histidine kinase